EVRYIGYAPIKDRLFCVVFTDRPGERRIISLRKANVREVKVMRIKTKSGRELILPTPEEDEAIDRGVAADPDTYELSDEEFKTLRPLGRPRAEVTKERITIRLSREVVD